MIGRRKRRRRPPERKCARCWGRFYAWSGDFCPACVKHMAEVPIAEGYSLREMISRRRAEQGFPPLGEVHPFPSDPRD